MSISLFVDNVCEMEYGTKFENCTDEHIKQAFDDLFGDSSAFDTLDFSIGIERQASNAAISQLSQYARLDIEGTGGRRRTQPQGDQ